MALNALVDSLLPQSEKSVGLKGLSLAFIILLLRNSDEVFGQRSTTVIECQGFHCDKQLDITDVNSDGVRHGLRGGGLVARPPPTVKHTGQELVGELCEIFKF